MSQDQELWKLEDWYPPLCPPTHLKKEILRDEDFIHVESRARTAPESSKENFQKLIEYLTKDLDSDLPKLRAIFMWMGAQNSKSTEVKENCADVDSPRYYLEKTASDRSLFGKLFARLCRGAGIPCLLVDGKVKGVGYEAGDEKIDGRNTWAVVYVDSSWRFMFPHWAFEARSGYQKENWTLVEDSGKAMRRRVTESAGITISHVEELWFLTDPEEMNCFCHPDDDNKQLLTRTWTEQEFCSLPYYQKSYFSSGWNLLNPTKCLIKPNRGYCEIEFQSPTANGKLNYQLFFNENHSACPLPDNVQTERYISSYNKDGGHRVSLIIRLPMEGRYKLEVTGVHGSKTCSLVNFRIDCDSVPAHTHPFPSQPDNGFGYSDTAVEAGLSEPSHTDGLVPVTSGQEFDVSFRVQKDVDVSARLVHATRTPEELRDNVSVQREETNATVKAKLPEDDPKPEFSLEIDTTKITDGTGGSVEKCWSVLNFLLTSNEVLRATTADKSKELKVQSSKKVYDAFAKDDATLFEEAVFEFETAEQQDPILYEKIKARKARYKQMLKEVRASTKEKDLDRLDRSIRACIRVNLHRGDIEAAKRKLVQLYKDKIQKFLEEEKLNDLRDCLDKAANTCVGESVEKEAWFQDARDRYEELDLLGKNKEKVQSMAEEDIADLFRPPVKVLDVFFAALILLGEGQAELTTWQQILTKISQLLARLSSFQDCSLSPEQVEVAKERLRRHDWTSDDEAATNKLYTWCMNRIRLHELRKKEKPGAVIHYKSGEDKCANFSFYFSPPQKY